MIETAAKWWLIERFIGLAIVGVLLLFALLRYGWFLIEDRLRWLRLRKKWRKMP